MLQPFNRPNLSGPRFRRQTRNLLNKSFCDQVRRHPLLKGLSDKQIKAIVHSAGAVVQETVVTSRDGVDLPESLGTLFIGAVPATKKRNVDYKKSIELGLLVHHHNFHTAGLTGKIFYTNQETRYRFRHHELWAFMPVRQFKKLVSRIFPEQYNRFVQVANWQKVSRMLRKPLLAASSPVTDACL